MEVLRVLAIALRGQSYGVAMVLAIAWLIELDQDAIAILRNR